MRSCAPGRWPTSTTTGVAGPTPFADIAGWPSRRDGGGSPPGACSGAPRLHYTIQTGAIATKEAAANHALEVFDPRWHTLIEDAVAFLHGDPAHDSYRDPVRRRRDSADFVGYVVKVAEQAATMRDASTGDIHRRVT